MSIFDKNLIKQMNESNILQKANPELSIKGIEKELIKMMNVTKFIYNMKNIKNFIANNSNIIDIYNYVKKIFHDKIIYAYDDEGNKIDSEICNEKLNQLILNVSNLDKYGIIKIRNFIFIHINGNRYTNNTPNNIICIINKI